MSLMRALLARFVQFKPRLQEELDIRKLYDLMYYAEQCMGNESSALNRPKNASYSEQFRVVHSAVTKQVIVAPLNPLRATHHTNVITQLNNTLPPHVHHMTLM